jgi:arylsulfatase A-like enzyme
MKTSSTNVVRNFRALALLLIPALASAAGESLPYPPQPFAGKLDPSAEKSTPAWPKEVKAPKSAPNIVVILLDDVGFSAPKPFGGVAETPTLEQLAQNGVSYNEFHVTSLCSPTRSAILTGRNHHEVGFGVVADSSSGFPGYNSLWSKDTVSLPEVLRQNGYSTAAFGKWHNTPTWEITPAGPFDHWPTSLGFEYFYGFMGGANTQYEPRLYRNTTPVEPPATPEQGYHLIADLADDSIRWLHVHDAVLPDKPFFLWLAPGGTHWPHHVPKEWIARYKGKFDQGWDKLREESFARQKKLGVIPANAELTPRPPELPAWDSLSAEQKRLLAREAEISAAYLAYTDEQLGRILASIRDEGYADNTLVFYIAGDNGAAISGNLEGTDAYDASGKPLGVGERLKLIDELGGPHFDNQYAAAWGWADNTPFQYGKGIPAYLGGTRNPLVVSWPAKITAKGAVRGQFAHVTDIAPTIYELTGIRFPDVVEGVPQVPLEGKSLAYSFDQADATTPRTLQYFEIGGTRGIYKDGWWAGSRKVTEGSGVWNQAPYGVRPWELYNLTEDYSQAHNVAAKYPDKVAELEASFDKEAWRNDVYPLSPPVGVGRPNPAKGRTLFTYRAGVTRIPSRNGPDVTRRAHRITADIVVPAKGGDGVIIADGGRWGGFALYIKGGKLVYAANAHGNQTGHIVSSIAVPRGKVQVAFSFAPDAGAAGASQQEVSAFGPQPVVPGQGRLFIDGKPVGEGHIGKITYSPYESLDIGADLGSPVSSDYKTPFAFAGTVDKVQVELR